MNVMHVAVVEIIGVPVVAYRHVPATGFVHVIMLGVHRALTFFHTSPFEIESDSHDAYDFLRTPDVRLSVFLLFPCSYSWRSARKPVRQLGQRYTALRKESPRTSRVSCLSEKTPFIQFESTIGYRQPVPGWAPRSEDRQSPLGSPAWYLDRQDNWQIQIGKNRRRCPPPLE